MEFLKLYNENNRNILFSISWLNKNSIFDKSIGSFKNIDLFTFLENINSFDYEQDIFYDDIYYILEYTKDSILHLINNINKEVKREHKIVPISQAKEFDKKTMLWLSRQNGRNIKEKLKNNKIKAVKRYRYVDTYENRIFKIFLKKLILIEEKRKRIHSNDYLIDKIRQWLRSDDAKNINEYGDIVYNNILLHHPHYSKIFKSYKWLNKLDEKVEFYSTSYIQQLKNILKFEILTQLQFFTTEAKILPNSLDNNDLNKFNISNSLIEIDLEEYISQIKEDKLKQFSFKEIKKFAKFIIENQIKIKDFKDRTFYIDTKNTNKVFIDLFRLFPIVKIDIQITNFPITLLQNVNDKIVNANNTKIIDLRNEIYTLPEILKTYNTNILRIFLEDFEKYFKNKQLNYIIPDYVNIFEFASVKKTINSYFPSSRNIPKSIVAGLQYLFNENLQIDDTLIYVQKNHDNDLYVTPLLVKYDKSLKEITNGLYLEKYPTKKLKEESDIINELNRYFNDNKLSKRLLSKFLQNGIKGIKEKQIAFYMEEKIIYLKNNKTFTKQQNRVSKIKALFNNKNLFKKNYIEIKKDNNIDNLNNFEKLLKYEKDGYNLWKEHLPRLAMGDMPMNGYFGEFVLVDDNSKVINGTIEIKNHFVIPTNTNELSFPLIFGEENINYEAYIASNQLPFTEDVKCELKLTYQYEDETPYKLIFIPLDKKYKPLVVKWREIKEKEYKKLPIPSYPDRKNWKDFSQDPKRDGSGYSNLLEWIVERLELLNNIEEIPNFILDNEINRFTQIKGMFKNGKFDARGKYFCYVEVNGEDVFCHSADFIEDINSNSLYYGMPVYLIVKKSSNGKLKGKKISFNRKLSRDEKIELIKKEYANKPLDLKLKPVIKSIQSIKYPLLTVWNNHSLSDYDAPNDFRLKIQKYIQLSLQHMSNNNIPKDLKEELFFFLSSIHQDMPIQISNTLIEFTEDETNINRYYLNIALSLGTLQLDWQEKIFNNLLKLFHEDKAIEDILIIYSIASWRSKEFINKFSLENINKIINILLESLYKTFENYKKNKKFDYFKKLVQKLEFLLALIRIRNKYSEILYPNSRINKKFIKFIDMFTKYCIDNSLYIKTRIKFKLHKPLNFKHTPDLLYALRMYLSGNIEATQNIKVLGVSDD